MVFEIFCKTSTGLCPLRRAGEQLRGIFSHVREYPPYTPKRTQGTLPLDPDIGSRALEELRSLRNRVRCTWLRHESLLSVTDCNRALLS